MSDPMIKKVKNGYMIVPYSPGGNYTKDEDIVVFETWEKMIAYLHSELEKSK